MKLPTAKIHRERSTTGAPLASTAIEILTAVVEVAAEVAIASASTAKYPPPHRWGANITTELLESVVVASHPRWKSVRADHCVMSAEIEIAARCKCGAVSVVRVDEYEVARGPRDCDAPTVGPKMVDLIDGTDTEQTAWCVYPTAEARDADQDGAHAPRVVRVDGQG